MILINEEIKEVKSTDAVFIDKRFKTLDELYKYAIKNDKKIIKLVNLAQIGFYASVAGCQPDYIDQSPYDKRLVAYYYQPSTVYAWYRWKRSSLSLHKENDKESEIE